MSIFWPSRQHHSRFHHYKPSHLKCTTTTCKGRYTACRGRKKEKNSSRAHLRDCCSLCVFRCPSCLHTQRRDQGRRKGQGGVQALPQRISRWNEYQYQGPNRQDAWWIQSDSNNIIVKHSHSNVCVFFKIVPYSTTTLSSSSSSSTTTFIHWTISCSTSSYPTLLHRRRRRWWYYHDRSSTCWHLQPSSTTHS